MSNDACDLGIVVESADLLHKHGLICVLEPVDLVLNPYFVTGLDLLANIRLRSNILTCQQDSQGWRAGWGLRDLDSETLEDSFGELVTVYDSVAEDLPHEY